MTGFARAALALTIGGALLAVASPAGAVFPVTPVEGQGKAFVYIYRTPTLFNAARAASFYLDGAKIADIGTGGCVMLEVAAGRHVLEEQWKSIPLMDLGNRLTSPDERVGVQDVWADGGVYFYRLNIWSEMGRTYNEQVIRWDLRRGDPASDLPKVRSCKQINLQKVVAGSPADLAQRPGRPEGSAEPEN